MMRLKESHKLLLTQKKLNLRDSLLENDVRHTLSVRKISDSRHRSNRVVPLNIEEEVKEELGIAP